MVFHRSVIPNLVGVYGVQGPDDFLPLLLTGRNTEQWEWSTQGVCLFLGGDQMNAVRFYFIYFILFYFIYFI